MIDRIISVLSQTLERMFNFIRLTNIENRKYWDLMTSIPTARLPENIRKSCPKGIQKNAEFMAGYVRHITPQKDSVELIVTYKKRRNLMNMTAMGTSGVDVYSICDEKYIWRACVTPKSKNGMYAKLTINGIKAREVVALFMPSFAQIDHIFVKKTEATPLDIQESSKRTMVVYGSSITQGCAGSRPGLNYVNILQNQYGYLVRNYGFSESAKGEKNVIEYIAKENADIYVLEYDHNATVLELEKTHEQVYKTIRENNVDAYIILITRISGGISISDEEESRRYQIVYRTYKNACEKGDMRIGLIRGKNLVLGDPWGYLADDRHPNDIGMKAIARSIHEKAEELCSSK